MKKQIVVIGAGMGGLTASIELNNQGFDVVVLEARDNPGGLASRSTFQSVDYDTGPYILLDRPGLEWTFHELGLSLEEIPLTKIDPVYSVQFEGGQKLIFWSDPTRTANEFDSNWPGSGKRYLDFIRSMAEKYEELSPLLHREFSRLKFLTGRSIRSVPFLLKSLKQIMEAAHLPVEVQQGISIWTRVAGQNLNQAPAPMAFVPALFHTIGAFYPIKGIAQIPEYLAAKAQNLGVQFRYRTRVRSIRLENDQVAGVETDSGEFLGCECVLSNAHGLSTYLNLLDPVPPKAQRQLGHLPLQSPGVCAYLRGIAKKDCPYLQFFISPVKCRLLILPQILTNETGPQPARLLASVAHETTERLTKVDQEELLQQLMQETWWQSSLEQCEMIGGRVPLDWGSEFYLYRNSMNPVMTAEFMRRGRLAHRSPYVQGLYLAGSSTHPGQWISFAGISGILSARQLAKELR